MKFIKHTFPLIILLGGFVSCKKCYHCEKDSVCSTCEVVDPNGNQFSGQEACGTEEEISDFERSFTSSWGNSGFIVNCVRQKEMHEPKDICGGPDKAEDEAFILELAGYKCIDK